VDLTLSQMNPVKQINTGNMKVSLQVHYEWHCHKQICVAGMLTVK